MQQDLFADVLEAYDDGELSNQQLYQKVAKVTDTTISEHIKPVGKAHTLINLWTRKVRWCQQSLKRDGLIEKIGHGQWRLTKEGKHRLTRINVDRYMVAANTQLGAMIWGNSANVFDKVITDDVHLVLTSPPYLGIGRSYGTYKDEQQYIGFILSVLAPLRKRMVKGANLALNITQDSFLTGTYGVRSLYLERLTLALADELDLHLMDRLVWHAPNKAPGPTQFVSKRRTMLNAKYEPILWFCSSPEHCIADNRTVLEPYKTAMKKLIAQGGEQVARQGGDSKHCSKVGSFAKDNGGAIPGNVITIGTTCQNKRQAMLALKQQGLPPHSATFPLALASFLVKWLCPLEDGLTVDPFGGLSTVGVACEALNKPWLTAEIHYEYIKAALSRFDTSAGFHVNPLFTQLEDNHLRYRYAAA